MSHRVHTGVILQYAWYRYLCTLVCYCTPRYTYRSHFGSCIRDTTHSVGNASDYPACQHLRTVSKDELLSHFYETPSIWGDRQNTPCSSFAKGPRFLDMVITFVQNTPCSIFFFPLRGPLYRLPIDTWLQSKRRRKNRHCCRGPSFNHPFSDISGARGAPLEGPS